jgi:uncharacterized repeat protein (TIGR01451 family)
MKDKSIISVMLILFTILSGIGFSFAASGTGGGTGGTTPNPPTIITLFDKDTVNVGDNVTLLVTITNTGPYNYSQVLVKAKLPDGITFLYSATGLDRNIYDPATGIWDVGNMTYGKKGASKSINITGKVSSSISGQTVTAGDVKFTQVYYNNTTKILKLDTLPSSVSTSLKVNKTSTETGNSTSNGTNNINTGSSNKKTVLAKTIKNATSQNGLDTLTNVNQPTTQGSAYEVTNATASPNSDNPKTIFVIIGGLIIAAIVGIGYFKGIKG